MSIGATRKVAPEPELLHVLPDLPYPMDALQPHLSRETLQYHYGKHHRAYVDKLNELVRDTPYAGLGLEQVVRQSSGEILNNAAQTWNHSFYWQCLAPEGPRHPAIHVANAVEASFGTFDAFKDRFTRAALATFGSGWVWLVKNRDGSVSVTITGNAGTPIREGGTPLLACDVWEHAYYIDYRNQRPDYLNAFWRVVNWDFVTRNYGEPL